MSGSDSDTSVFTTRFGGEVAERTERYTENFDGSKSKALRELIEAGLESKRAGYTPEEYEQRLEAAKEEIKHEERRTDFYKMLSTAVAIAVLIPIFIGGGNQVLTQLNYGFSIPYPQPLVQVSGLLIFTAAIFRTFSPATLSMYFWFLDLAERYQNNGD